MRTIQASEFKARRLALLDEVAKTGEPLPVTEHGRPLVEIKPHKPPRANSLIALHKGRVKIRGDIIAPADDGEWDALE